MLRIGNTILVGQSTRTDDNGFSQLAKIVEPFGFRVVRVNVRGCLHLKTACTAIDDRTLLINPDWIETQNLVGFELISIPPEEPFAANTLPFRDSILIPASMTKTESMLLAKGYDVRTLDISEFSKAEAGLTCLSLLLN